ncbi:phosphate ABC transporter ATP-binding protein PstB [Flavihumibacter fluvii]|uniref:phosphate ABC transporter ATP-binding protein PstB n=1 Tax=Flavihumibacter fluvii TaxID=2838157 RepID=UPI001BDE112C|nr:phosphate ABC transporter ATP-binding protein PstB [Flavihumibacter fluvii]ULQ54698.1 phosphate ABC transporter ATP-binding protein PstB [Flavihumibacter fluvii]
MNNPIPKLATIDLRLSFGPKEVLKGITMEFPAKQITALIGPSGCGKTTLLRSFNRMHDLTPDANITGDILLNGISILHTKTAVTTIRRQIGMVFQKPNPFPKSIFDNVAYGLRINNIATKEIPGIVERSLRESYLWDEVKDELKKPATKLSGGQQQRLCIARAVAIRPDIILMDEPCSALDPISTLKVESLILELKKSYTVIIVTHNMQQAQRIADQTAFMYLGELIEYDKTEVIFNSANNKLTADYISGSFG